MLVSVVCLNIVVFSQNTKTLVMQLGPAGKDAYINSAYQHQNTCFGDRRAIISCAYTFQGNYGIGRSMLQFDLSAIPLNAVIVSAKLDLMFDPGNDFGIQNGDNATYLQRITSDWDENTVTWNTQPTFTTLNQVLLPTSTDIYQDYKDIDVTALIKDILLPGNENFGFLMNMIGTDPYKSMIFASGDNPDGALWPRLNVTYESCPQAHAVFTYDNSNGLTVLFNDNSPNTTSWLWEFGDGSTSQLQNPTHTYDFYGNYRCCLTVSNECSSEKYCYAISVGPSSIPQIEKEEVKIYPNPSSTGFSIESKDIKSLAQIKVVDLSGRPIKSEHFELSGNKIYIPRLLPGVYSLIIESEKGRTQTKLVSY